MNLGSVSWSHAHDRQIPDARLCECLRRGTCPGSQGRRPAYRDGLGFFVETIKQRLRCEKVAIVRAWVVKLATVLAYLKSPERRRRVGCIHVETLAAQSNACPMSAQQHEGRWEQGAASQRQ